MSAADKFVGGAEALLVEAGVGDPVTILKGARPVDPGALLLEEVARCAVVVRWLEDRIGSLDEESLLHEPELLAIWEKKRSRNPQGDNYQVRRTESRTTVNRLWTLLQEERKLLVAATTAALRSNIEERKIRLAERGINALETAVASALTKLGLDPNSDHVRSIVGAELRSALEGGGAGSLFMGGEVLEMEPLAVETVRNTVSPERQEVSASPPPPAAPF